MHIRARLHSGGCQIVEAERAGEILRHVREFVRKRSNLSARFTAVGLGAVTPFCSCSSVPLFIGFVEAGIPLADEG